MAVVEVQAGNNPQNINQIFYQLCDLFQKIDNGSLTAICKDTWFFLSPVILPLLEKFVEPDIICRKAGFCALYSECTLYSKWPKNAGNVVSMAGDAHINKIAFIAKGLFEEEGLKSFSRLFFRDENAYKVIWPWDAVADHLPFTDVDGDKYSPIVTLRGSNWRGKDCNDIDHNIYPGRGKNSSQSPYIDHDCNGIYGVNPNTQKSYEDELCGGTGARGVIVLGDSASAHFHLPAQLNPNSLLTTLEDELDFPQCSWSTGYYNTSECPFSPLKTGMSSLYMKMKERNKCNHRDYQNISVNGARSSSMHRTIMNTTARYPYDKPAIVIYALVGNDVCNGHPGFGSFTTPPEFRRNVLMALDYLETILPNNSHVVFVGLEHGEMWNINAHLQYPNNTIGGNITYAQLWDYINCLKISPCWGWLNSNATDRNLTVQWAHSLDMVYVELVATLKNYTKFDLTYIENPDLINSREWAAQGGNPSQLLEWVGGGHPSQLQHEMTANYLWKVLETKYPHIIGDINPNNAEIEKLFGNQGGY